MTHTRSSEDAHGPGHRTWQLLMVGDAPPLPPAAVADLAYLLDLRPDLSHIAIEREDGTGAVVSRDWPRGAVREAADAHRRIAATPGVRAVTPHARALAPEPAMSDLADTPPERLADLVDLMIWDMSSVCPKRVAAWLAELRARPDADSPPVRRAADVCLEYLAPAESVFEAVIDKRVSETFGLSSSTDAIGKEL